MAFTSDREKRLWWSAGLCLLLIYSTLYSVRPLVTFLRQRNLLRLSVAAAFLLAVVWVIRSLGRQRVGWRTVVGLVVAIGVYLAVFGTVEANPEELIHFLEYGLIAVLFDAALRERRRNASDKGGFRVSNYPGITAALLTLAAGWLDEAIQWALPNRFYDIRDVAFNGGAAVMALVVVRLLDWCQKLDGRTV